MPIELSHGKWGRAPDKEYVSTTDARFVVLVPGRSKARKRLRNVSPRLMTRLSILRAPLALQSRCNTWAKKYKIAERGQNLPAIQAYANSMFVIEGAMEVRRQMRELLELCAQDYHFHSAGHKDPWSLGGPVVQGTASPICIPHGQGYLIVLGVTTQDTHAYVHTHLGVSVVTHEDPQSWLEEAGLWHKQCPEDTGYPIQPPVISDHEREKLCFLMDLVTFCGELGICEHPMFDVNQDGTVDLGLLPQFVDDVTKALEDDIKTKHQVGKRYEQRTYDRDEAEMLAQNRDYVPFWAAGEEQEVPELLHGVPVLRRPNVRDVNTSRRMYLRVQVTKDLGLTVISQTEDAYASNWRKVRALDALREQRTWTPRGEDNPVSALVWNKGLFRGDWLVAYTDATGKVKTTVNRDFFRLLEGAVRYGVECGSVPVHIAHRVDETEYEKDGEIHKANRDYSKNRYFGALRNYPSRGGWWRWCPCAEDNQDRARKSRNGRWETPHRQHIHVDKCMVCGREASVVDAYAYIPVGWLADALRIEALPVDTHVKVPIFGEMVEWLMTTSAMAKHASQREVLPGDIQWFEFPEPTFKVTEHWTYPGRLVHQAPAARDRQLFIGPDRKLHLVINGGHWVHKREFPPAMACRAPGKSDLRQTGKPGYRIMRAQERHTVVHKPNTCMPSREIQHVPVLYDHGLEEARRFLLYMKSALRSVELSHRDWYPSKNSKHWRLV